VLPEKKNIISQKHKNLLQQKRNTTAPKTKISARKNRSHTPHYSRRGSDLQVKS